MIQTDRVGKNYADNLLDPYLTFQTSQTWSVSSGTGSAGSSNDYSFNGNNCLKIQNTAPTTDITVTNSIQNTIIGNKSVEAQFSMYLFKNSSSDTFTGEIEIFKNAVSLDTQTFSLSSGQDLAWYRFVTDTTYSLVTTDVITFTITFNGDAGFSGTKNLYLGGWMLNDTDRLNSKAAPPIYTPPSESIEGTGWGDYADTAFTSGSPLSLAAATQTVLENNAQTRVETQKPTDIVEFYSPAYLNFDAKTGVFTVGSTLTGGTSGATAVIAEIEDNGTTGRLYLQEISGTFQDNETITDAATGSATADGILANGVINGKNGDAYTITIDFKAKPTNAGTSYLEIWFDIGGSVGELYRRIVTFPKGNGVERLVTLSTGVYTLNTWETNGAITYVEADNTCDIYDIRFVITRVHKAV